MSEMGNLIYCSIGLTLNSVTYVYISLSKLLMVSLRLLYRLIIQYFSIILIFFTINIKDGQLDLLFYWAHTEQRNLCVHFIVETFNGLVETILQINNSVFFYYFDSHVKNGLMRSLQLVLKMSSNTLLKQPSSTSV